MARYPKKILCVDDDHDDCFLLQKSIQQLSDIVIENAYDGEEALKVLENQKLSGDLPCLIVMDINMPVMDGIKTIESIKKDDQLKNIPLVVFSTSLKTLDEEYIKKQNIEALTKPLDWSSYKEIANKLLTYCE
jgi:CheY-like chemotaxis protein